MYVCVMAALAATVKRTISRTQFLQMYSAHSAAEYCNSTPLQSVEQHKTAFTIDSQTCPKPNYEDLYAN